MNRPSLLARRPMHLVLLTVAMLAATWIAGWWGPALVAAAWGWRGRALDAAIAAFVAWAALLAWTASTGAVMPFAARLGGIFSLPAWAMLLLSPLFAALLAWGAATLLEPLRKGEVPMRTSLFVVLALGSAAPVQAQNLDSVQIRTVPLSRGLAMLMGAGGNMAVSWGEDATFLVDDQFAPLTPKIVAAISKLTPNPTRFVLNTHFHGDHSGGNENFGQAGAVIVAHENVRRRMSTEQFSRIFNRSTPASPGAALPVVTFTDQVTFHQNGEDISVFHVNAAHTDGDAIVWFRGANVIHMGDTFFLKRYPFIDVDGGGSIEGLVTAIDRVLGIIDNNTRVIPGHGELATKADLAEYRNVIATARDRVKKLIAEGKTLEQAVAARPLAEYDATWGAGFIKPDVLLRLLYASYGK